MKDNFCIGAIFFPLVVFKLHRSTKFTLQSLILFAKNILQGPIVRIYSHGRIEKLFLFVLHCLVNLCNLSTLA